MAEYFPRRDSPKQSLEHITVSPTLFFSNLNDEIGCMSPYSSEGNIMDYYGNWDVPYEAYDQISSVSYPL